MKTSIKIFLIALVVLAPNFSHAYLTTDQKATKISDTVALYQIDFKFGHGTYDVHLPVRAKRDQAWGSNATTVGFEVYDPETGATKAGSAAGVVISKFAELTKDELYGVSKGFGMPFSLFVVLEVPKNSAPSDYGVRVTDLPFFFGPEKDPQRLNPSELTYYSTAAVELNN